MTNKPESRRVQRRAPRTCSEFPSGFKGDMKALHKHHQARLADARKALDAAKREVERWERLEEASSRLAMVAMQTRWAKDSATQNAAYDGRQGVTP